MSATSSTESLQSPDLPLSPRGRRLLDEAEPLAERRQLCYSRAVLRGVTPFERCNRRIENLCVSIRVRVTHTGWEARRECALDARSMRNTLTGTLSPLTLARPSTGGKLSA